MLPGGSSDHARGKALAEHLEADDQVGDDETRLALADARADAPRQEFGVALDIGDQREQLLRRVGKHTLFGMGRHGGRFSAAASLAVRAARSRAKSSPA